MDSGNFAIRFSCINLASTNKILRTRINLTTMIYDICGNLSKKTTILKKKCLPVQKNIKYVARISR